MIIKIFKFVLDYDICQVYRLTNPHIEDDTYIPVINNPINYLLYDQVFIN